MSQTTDEDTRLLAARIKSAVENQDIEEVRHIMSQISDPFDKSKQEMVWPALDVALFEGYVEIADLFITRAPRFVRWAPVDDSVVWGGHIPIAECLVVKHGWDVNSDMDVYGHVLGHAISIQGEDKPDFCCWLIEHGADIHLPQGPGHITPLEQAYYCNGDPKLIECLRQNGATMRGEKTLFWAAECGQLEVLRVLLTEERWGGVDVNAEVDESDLEDALGGTALHCAATCGKVECLKFLLSKGANKDIRNRAGMTPKDVALSNQHFDCVAALEEAP